MNPESKRDPLAIPNVRWFVAFRVFFSARFYYPVFTIMFLDFGLTLEQFALLNAVWAATIVIAEVSSGALADAIGRKKLLVTAGALMVLEMILLAVVPLGHPTLLFGAFLLNRILSGIAEAAASGADEALAYDTLTIEGNAEDWGRVLDFQIRARSAAFIIAMSVGAAVYDPVLMQQVADLVGIETTLTQEMTLRFPIYLTLLMAAATLFVTLRMTDPAPSGQISGESIPSGTTILQAFRMTLEAGRWIIKTPFALVIILSGLLFDSIIRMIVTVSSQYYRVIGLPEASFGLIGSGLAVLGLFVPRVALNLTRHRTPAFNFGTLSLLTLAGLVGVSFCFPIYGIVPVVFLVCAMYLTGFFVSHYLNRITSAHRRATVLSFKGLSFNMAYGLIGIFYSLLLAYLRPDIAGRGVPGAVEDAVFIASLRWFPVTFLCGAFLLILFAARYLKRSDEHRRHG
jgi:MFS family permease